MQNAVLGNTAFLVGIEAVTRLHSIDILVTIRNNATFDRNPSKFWPGMTQVFVEFLPLESANDADGTPLVLASPGNVTYLHQVWPKKVSYSAFTGAGGETLTIQCKGMLLSTHDLEPGGSVHSQVSLHASRNVSSSAAKPDHCDYRIGKHVSTTRSGLW